MKHLHLKTAYYKSTRFENIKQFYIVENNDDLSALKVAFPKLKYTWGLIFKQIKKIISDGYVAIVTDINPKSNCIEVFYENKIPHKYTYDNAFHRATDEEVSSHLIKLLNEAQIKQLEEVEIIC